MVPRTSAPAEIARTALKRLAELGLPPTPENYVRFYYDIAGVNQTASDSAGPANPDPASAKVVAEAQHAVNAAAQTTSSLADLIQDHNADIRLSLDHLHRAQQKDDITHLLGNIIDTATAMHGSVSESRDNLSRLASALQEMREDMAATRRIQEQDKLTGAQNRQSLDDLLTREVKRASSYDGRLSIALIDLDNIGQINKQHGEGAADRVLIHIANLAKAVLRQQDYLVRYSNEEFLLVLPDTEIGGCRYLLERLRQVFQKNPVIYKNKPLDATFSAGIAQLADEEQAPNLLLRADHAMRRAQSSGINQTEIADNTRLFAE